MSNDPRVAPEIDPHYFERGVGESRRMVKVLQGLSINHATTDLDILVEGVKWVRDVYASTAPFKDIISMYCAVIFIQSS